MSFKASVLTLRNLIVLQMALKPLRWCMLDLFESVTEWKWIGSIWKTSVENRNLMNGMFWSHNAKHVCMVQDRSSSPFSHQTSCCLFSSFCWQSYCVHFMEQIGGTSLTPVTSIQKPEMLVRKMRAIGLSCFACHYLTNCLCSTPSI